jgi:hypothetical protein
MTVMDFFRDDASGKIRPFLRQAQARFTADRYRLNCSDGMVGAQGIEPWTSPV